MINKKAVISGLVVSLACSYGGYRLHKDNPYISEEIIPRITNESLIPDKISDIYKNTMNIYKENFPEYNDLFDERMKDIRIHVGSVNKYTNEPMTGSVFVQKKDQLLIIPSRMSKDFPHEALHALTDKESTGVLGLKKSSGLGTAVNEGFATLVHSELFLDNPIEIEEDTLYNVELSSARIITSIVGKDKMIKYFFEEEYSIDEVINELGIVIKNEELANEYIIALDDYNKNLTDYALMYTRYKNNQDMYKGEVLELFNKLTSSLEKVFSLSYKVMNNYIKSTDIDSDYIIWFNDQMDYMQNKFTIENFDENYYEYLDVIDKLSFNSEVDSYKYKALIKEDKTSYWYK